jgi:protein involved in polysaccharide export with SLBB domain
MRHQCIGKFRNGGAQLRGGFSRRINKPTSETPTGIYGEVFTFSFKDGYVIDGQPGFILKPYDHIMVRKSPDYMPQQLVKVTGEVAFPGSYPMVKKEERISDLVAKAGGITSWAYLRGARLQRKIIGEEKTRMLSTKEFFDSARDSVNMKRLDMDDRYFVGIDLAKALANPGSDADLVLREGDILGIPEYINTVKISGNVMFPNTVTYDPNMTVREYVTMAGGYGYRSQRSKAYVIYLNGTIEKARRFSSKVVEPGCEIVIPEKPEKKSSLQSALSITSSVTSMAAMIATMISVLK